MKIGIFTLVRKIWFDTTTNSAGKYSRKSLTALSSFLFAVIYELVLPFFGLQTKDYVFLGLLALAGGTLAATVVDKQKNSTLNPPTDV